MKAKIIILLSLILIAVSTYSYAGGCYYYPDGSISIAEFFAGKCAPVQRQVAAAHKPVSNKDWSRIKKPTKAKVKNRFAKNRRINLNGNKSRLRGLHKEFTRKGYGMRIIRSTNKYGAKVFDYEVNLPCFYTNTATGNTPCRRGRFRR